MVEIKLTSKKLAAIKIITLVILCVISLFMMLYMEVDKSKYSFGYHAYENASYVVLPLILIYIGYLLYNNFIRESYLLFNTEGVTDYQTFKRYGFISWDTIAKVYLVKKHKPLRIEVLLKTQEMLDLKHFYISEGNLSKLLSYDKIKLCHADEIHGIK